MANDNSRFLKDTQDLIRLYNQDISFQRRVDELINTPGATYRNRPLRLYVITLARFSPRYKEYERAVRKDPNKISELLINFYRQGDYFRFGKLAPLTKVFNPEEQKTLTEAENTASGQEQFKKFNSFLAQKDKEEEIPSSDRQTLFDSAQGKLGSAPTPTSPTLPTTPIPPTIPNAPLLPTPSSPSTEPKEEKPVEIEESLPQVQDKIPPIITSTPPTLPTTPKGRENPAPTIPTPYIPPAIPPTPPIPPIIPTPPTLPLQTTDLRFRDLSDSRNYSLPTPPHLPIPSFVKNLASQAKILVIRHPEAAANIASTTIGALTGFGVLRTPLGLALGAAGGGAIPFAVKKGLLSGSTGGLALKGIAGIGSKGLLAAAGPIGWVAAAGSIVANKKILKWIIIGIVAFIVGIPFFFKINEQNALLGVPGVTDAINSPGQPSPGTGTSGDIASCTFTRVGQSLPIKSQQLMSWISSAASNQGIPPAILASIARHESPNKTSSPDSDPDIQNNRFCNPGERFCVDLSINERVGNQNCESAPNSSRYKWAQAFGLMQALDIYNPGVDLCNIQQNITAGAQTLKGKIGGGSFTNETDVKKAVCGYFGIPDATSCNYPGGFDYAAEVWEDFQKCQSTTPNITPAPCTDGNYLACLVDKYKIRFTSDPGNGLLQKAYEIMSYADTVAPRFKIKLLDGCTEVIINPISGTSHAEGKCQIALNITTGKLIFIHELSHIIHNSNPSLYESMIAQARTQDSQYQGGFLTYYSKFASAPTDFSTICYTDSSGGSYLLDEEFAESVAYFINNTSPENSMSTASCMVFWSGENPYLNGQRYQGHYQKMLELLK